MAKPSVRDMERVKRIGRYLARKPRAKCWCRWQQSGELEGYSDADWGGDKATQRSVSAGVIMRGGHCLKVWTKKQQVVPLSSAESEQYAAVKTASEGLGIQSLATDLGISCGLNLHLDCLSDDVLGQPQRTGAKRSTSTCRICGYKRLLGSGRFTTRKVGTSVNPANLMTKPLPKRKIEQLMNLMSYEFMETGSPEQEL